MFWRRKTAEPSLLPLAALISQTGEGRGVPPSAAEFRALAENTLSVARRAEIESQLAHDPAVFRAFMNSAAARRASAPTSHRTRNWLLSPVGLGAAASIAICAVVLGLLRSPEAPSPSQGSRMANQRQTKPASTPVPDWRRRAVRYGMENPGWFSGSAPDTQGQAFEGDCGPGGCDAEIDALTRFGALVAGLGEKCSDSPAPGVPLDATRQRRELDSLLPDVNDRTWHAEMQTLARVLPRPARESCPVVSRMMRAAGANKN